MARIAVVGAGLSGMGAARRLVRADHAVTVFEKSRGVGGRMASRRVGDTVIDHGLPALWLDGGALAERVESLPAQSRVRISLPVGGMGEGVTRDGGPPPIAYRPGLTTLAKMILADAGIAPLLSARITDLRPASAGIELGDEQGNGRGVFDAVIVSAPAPQAAELLSTHEAGHAAAGLLEAVEYDPALVVAAGIRPPARPPWFGVRGGPDDALSWLGVETAKGREAVDGVVPVVAHLSASLSRDLYDVSDGEVLEVALPEIEEIVGSSAGAPVWAQVKRWRYSRPRSTVAFAALNPAGSRLMVCGDATTDDGVEAVYASGIAAANGLLAAFAGT